MSPNLELEERKRQMLGRNTSHYRDLLLKNMTDEQRKEFEKVEEEAAEEERNRTQRSWHRPQQYSK